jgi:lysophospholipase L1-like esterase
MTPSPERPRGSAPAPTTLKEAASGLALVVFAGLVTVTCTSTSRPPVAAPPSPDPTGSVSASVEPPTLASAAAASASASTSAAPSPPLDAAEVIDPSAVGVIPLPRFQTALRALADGKRTDHVRITWLGDSHTAADFWTGAVRKGLQKSFGNGGPGFVHVGWSGAGYRHDGFRGIPSSTWKIRPGAYAQTTVTDDGVFGLGGVRFEPREAQSRTGFAIVDPALLHEPLTFDLAYRLPADTAVPTVTVGDQTGALTPSEPGKISHFRVTGAAGSATLHLDGAAHVQLFGAVVEGAKPGVVLDTVGLNGARVATFLAWDEATWVAELARRKSDLIVFAFGTNESQDLRGGAERYGEHLDALVARVRKAIPATQSECLVITPIDRRDEAAALRLAKIRDVLAARGKAAGCAIWDAQAAMGGHGAMAAWAQETPARAGGDGVHLTGRGYASLGERLAAELSPPVRKAKP